MTDAEQPTNEFSTPEQVQAAADAFRADFAAVRQQIGRAVVGHEEVVRGVLV